jgi:hypothetical protein
MMSTSNVPAEPAMAVEAQLGGETFNDLFVFVDDQVQRGATRFLLAQRREQQAINDWHVAEIHDTQALTAGIYTTAAREANALRESVVYVLYAQRGSMQAGKCMFRIDGGPQVASEQGNERDVIGMLIRHTEGTTRLSLTHSRDMVGHHEALLSKASVLYERLLAEAARQLDKAHARISVLEERELEQSETRDQLRVAMSSLELEKAESRRKDQEVANRHKERTQAIKEFAPQGMALLSLASPGLARAVAAVAAQTAGAGGAVAAVPSPANPPAEATRAASATSSYDHLVERLFTTLGAEQLQRIGALLTAEQLSIVLDLHDQVTTRLQQRAAAEAAAEQVAAASPEATPSATPPKEGSPP